jgi:isoquinoline 1-oxidoreductase beta subunit
MLYGTVRMSPVFGGRSREGRLLRKAEKMPGVVKIVPLTTSYGSGFGVIAENTWAAFKAAEAIEVEWGKPALSADSAGIMKVIADAASGEGDACATTAMSTSPFADAPPTR